MKTNQTAKNAKKYGQDIKAIKTNLSFVFTILSLIETEAVEAMIVLPIPARSISLFFFPAL